MGQKKGLLGIGDGHARFTTGYFPLEKCFVTIACIGQKRDLMLSCVFVPLREHPLHQK